MRRLERQKKTMGKRSSKSKITTLWNPCKRVGEMNWTLSLKIKCSPNKKKIIKKSLTL